MLGERMIANDPFIKQNWKAKTALVVPDAVVCCG